MRVAVIGAGPVGIAAALGALDRGHDVTVVERGAVGASLLTWGPTRFFTAVAMNATPRMREVLGHDAPGPEEILTGPEYAARVLGPLVEREPLRGRVRTGTRVVAVARRGLTRADYAGHPLRAERPFRLLCEGDGGEEVLEADAVLDCSGGLTVPRPFGAGGLPPLGERSLPAPPIRTLGDLHARQEEVRGGRVLLVGDGHSAANAILVLEELAASAPAPRVVWAVRTPNRRPCEETAHDPLPERRRVAERANALAAAPPEWLRMERRAMIERIDGRNVTLTGGRVVEADVVAAFTGYRPEGSFLSELEVELSPVTEGGARLYRAVSCATDCLSVPAVTPADLESGEPGYYLAGSRAYGRSRNFLLQTGFAQLETILRGLGEPERR